MAENRLPEPLLIGAHSRERWISSGVPRYHLTGSLWERLSHGMYAWCPASDDLAGVLHRIGGLAPPGGALGGWGAAHLLGAIDVDGETAAGDHLPVPLCMPRQQTCRRVHEREGRPVRIWRSDLEPEDVVRVSGTPVTSAVRTGFDLARLSAIRGGAGRGPVDAVEALVLLEALLRTGRASAAEITEYADRHRRKQGTAQALWVLSRAVATTRSCQETRFRMLWTLDAGLPAPLVNARIATPEGVIVAEVDLLDPESGLVGEYDGAHHASADRRAIDHARAHDLEQLGLTVMRAASPDLGPFRRRTVERLRSLRERALRRDRRLDRWLVA